MHHENIAHVERPALYYSPSAYYHPLTFVGIDPQVKHICAGAFCNLADLPAMHSRLIEEGAVSTVSIDRECYFC